MHFLTNTEIALWLSENVCWSRSCPYRPGVDAWTCHSCQEDTGPSCTRWRGKCCVGSRVGVMFSSVTSSTHTHHHLPKTREDLTCVCGRGGWKSTSSHWHQHLVSDYFTWEKKKHSEIWAQFLNIQVAVTEVFPSISFHFFETKLFATSRILPFSNHTELNISDLKKKQKKKLIIPGLLRQEGNWMITWWYA